MNLKKFNPFYAAMVLAALIFLLIMGLIFTGNLSQAGPAFIALFALLALGFSGYKALNGYVFTTMIFAGVSLALFYPQYFIQLGDFKFTALIIPLIQIIMFGMGTSMSLRDFAAVIKSPKGVLVG